MPKPTREPLLDSEVKPVKPVETDGLDGEHMTTAELLTTSSSLAIQTAMTVWKGCYILSLLYRRDDWREGRNRTLRFDDFYVWYAAHQPGQAIDRDGVYKRLVVYDVYSNLPNAEQAAKAIIAMGTIKQAYQAVRWVKEYPDQALEILKLCAEYRDLTLLRGVLATKYRLKRQRYAGETPPPPPLLGEDEGVSINEGDIVEYLAMNPMPLLNNVLFDPRGTAEAVPEEVGFYSVARAVTRHLDISCGELYRRQMLAHLDNLSKADRAAVLADARITWAKAMELTRRGFYDMPDWLEG